MYEAPRRVGHRVVSAPDPPPARVVLRPIGTPLPLGFLGLFLATAAFATLQLDWIPADQGRLIALAVLAFTVPLQLVAAVFGFLARDPVAGTGMGVLSGTWAVAGLVTLTSPPGQDPAPALGVVLVLAALAMLVPAVAGAQKGVAAAIMAGAALRFAVTGVAELTGSGAWLAVAGWVGLALAALALYGALGFELEDARHATVLPLLRRGAARKALRGSASDELADVTHEAGVRAQL